MSAIQQISRGEIRRSIGKNLGILIDGVATAADDGKTLLTDTKNLLGGADEHNQKEVLIYDAAGSIADGESSIVSDFASNVATCVPVFSAAIAIGDKFEMWKTPWRIADINDAINQAINDITAKSLKIKETHTAFTETGKYLYDVLSNFTHLYRVEYVYNIGTEKTIHKCDAVWNEKVATGVTASIDTNFKKEGSGCLKLILATAAATGVLASEDITSLDISGCSEAQIWVYSTIALDAGDIQLLLDNTAECASPLESLNIPATAANTWTRHIISLANPQRDYAIISVGLGMVVDKGSFDLRVDDIKAIDARTNEYRELPIEYWNIAQGSTPYLQITDNGLDLISDNKQLRLSGFQIPSRMTVDSTTSEVDPGWLVAQVTGRLLISHAKSSYLDIHDRARLSQYWLGEAAKIESGITTSVPGTARVIQ